MKREFNLTRSLLSGYYVAVMMSFFLFQLLSTPIQTIWTTWFISFLNTIMKVEAKDTGAVWLSLVFICFIIVFCIRRLVVEVLDLHSREMDTPKWENWVLFFLVFGFFLYTINLVFKQPMPTNWFPSPIIKLFGGEGDYTLINSPSLAERNTWTIVPWLWTAGPWIFMMFTTISAKFKTGEK